MLKQKSLYQSSQGLSQPEADRSRTVYIPDPIEAACDAINILELSSMPLRSARLRRAKLLKNIRLGSVIEMIANTGGGSGQVECSQIYKHFNWLEGANHPDQKLLIKLGKLPSYDVFSLRVALRRLGIDVDDMSALQLSEKKKSELTGYMKNFTAPLIKQIYGSHETEVMDYGQLIEMFRHSDKEAVRQNLIFLAQRLQIELHEVPQFLEDYADIFLSIAYFQGLFDTLMPRIDHFLVDLKRLLIIPEFRHDACFVRDAAKLQMALSNIIAAVAARFESFNAGTKNMWSNINAESFDRVRKMITAHHAAVGGMLCGLSVKIRGWDEAFANLDADMHQRKRMYFIQGVMIPGIEMISGLNKSLARNSLGKVYELVAASAGFCVALLGEFEGSDALPQLLSL